MEEPMNPRNMRRGALALIASAAVGAAGMSALAAGVPTASRNITNGTNELSYSPARLQVKIPKGKTAIRVTLRYRNTGFSEHNVAIKGNRVARRARIVGAGKGTAVTAVLRAGTYTYYCTVPGHEAAGMKGTLRVVRVR
jgi:nitrite reductase (NO-forming)